MKVKPLIKPYQQKGVGLLEALIALLLSSIVVLGATYSIGRILTSQKQTNVQYLVINELRNKLQTATNEQKSEWCAGTTKPTIETISIASNAIVVSCPETSVTVNNAVGDNVSIDYVQPIEIQVTSDLLGGQLTVGKNLP